MLGAPKVKDVRGFSDFGYSYVYIIFDEGTDIYWARSRTLEYLSNGSAPAAAGRQDRTRAGRHRHRLGISVCADRHHRQAQPGRSAQLPGLVSALLPEVRSRRGRGGAARRVRPAVPGQRRSRTSCRRTTSRSARWWRRCAAATTTSAAGWWSSAAPSTWCAAAATRNRPTTSARSCSRRAPNGVPIRVAGRGRGDARARHPPRRRRLERDRRHGRRHRRSCARARTRSR